MQIHVNTTCGKIITFRVKDTVTIQRVKAAIQEIENVPTKQQRLLFAGMALANEKTLAECNIKNEDTLDLLICQCGC